MDINQSWRTYQNFRLDMRRRYKSVWRIPLQRRAVDVIGRHAADGMSCLDVGGSERSWQGMRERLPDLQVKTLNIDPEDRCDYRSLDDVDQAFDLVLMIEMIEHVPLEQGLDMLRKIRPLLKPNGKLVVTTPNLFHPNRFWDATHITPYRYDELGAALLATGYDVVELWRLHNEATLPRWFRRAVGVWLHRYLGVDFALSIAAVGSPAGADRE